MPADNQTMLIIGNTTHPLPSPNALPLLYSAIIL